MVKSFCACILLFFEAIQVPNNAYFEFLLRKWQKKTAQRAAFVDHLIVVQQAERHCSSSLALIPHPPSAT